MNRKIYKPSWVKWRYKNSLIPPFWWICSDSLPRKMKNENNLSWGPILKCVEKSGVLVNLDENNYTLTATQVDESYDSVIIYVPYVKMFRIAS